MAGKDDSDLIRGQHPSAFSRWSLPSFDEAPHYVALDREQEEAAQADEDPAEAELEEVEAPQPFTVEELEQIREEAYNEGFATGEKDGFHSGQLKGQQEARDKLDGRLVELENLMSNLMQPMQNQDAQIEEMLLMLVQQTVRSVIQRELETDSSQILHVLRGALKSLPMGADNIRIYLNPADFEAVKALRERHEENWRLLEDDQLLPGGCRVETEHSQIDASLETRLEQALTQLQDQHQEQRAHPVAPDMDALSPLPESPGHSDSHE
ncbi:flagellar assembly protein FliH [Halopseudomonas salegens]|uniref:Flagellar assembly protein FliH n=1 Tax=Halopseudomonas salegens TaxID=1434072 RepID=A0A1H2G417_9GAMM|nr:flagellar assembly protein FliH [Halopseudomonas salegens]SDU14250.1 flagellar assembly protein FliH [Halopseudomonas salegens]